MAASVAVGKTCRAVFIWVIAGIECAAAQQPAWLPVFGWIES
jgi:hypothetical protein